MMELENLVKLIQAVSDSALSGFEYEEGNVKLNIRKEKEPVKGTNENVQVVTIEQKTQAAKAEIPAMEPNGNLVKSPLVGTFYAAPAEDARPFVSVGDSVKKGQTVAIVEAMKLMNEIESEFDGTVAEVLVKNGEAVEYGQPLFRIA